jgi:hypothetical protein
MRVVSRLSAGVSGGRMVGKRLASRVLPVPGGPIIKTLWQPATAMSRALGVVLAFHIDEVLVHVGMLGEKLLEVDRFGVHLELAGEEADRLGQAADGINIEPFDDGRLGGVGGGDQQAIAPFGNGLDGHRQDAFDRPGLAGEGQLADDGAIAGPVERDLAAGQQQPQGDRQVEAVGVLLQIGRSEVSRRTSSRACYAGSWSLDWKQATNSVVANDRNPVPVRDDIQGEADLMKSWS